MDCSEGAASKTGDEAAAGSSTGERGEGGGGGAPMFVGPYLLGPTLGKGTTGKVKLCVHQRTRRTAAVKIVRKALLEVKPGARQRLEREISILKQLRHPNVMRIWDLMQTGTHIFGVWQSQKHTQTSLEIDLEIDETSQEPRHWYRYR